jgi:hypothetical protein
MPDWEKLVGGKLAGMKLEPEQRREVVTELAAHLEECHRELQEAGSPDAEGCTLAQVEDWEVLGRRIVKAKEEPMSFTRQVLVPGMLALFVSQAAQMVIRHTPPPFESAMLTFSWMVGASTVAQFIAWMVAVALAGALGAWLSRRLGGRPGQRLTAALFPALSMMGLMVFIIVVTALTRPHELTKAPAAEFYRYLMTWVLAPGLTATLGALPFLFGAARRRIAAPPANALSA